MFAKQPSQFRPRRNPVKLGGLREEGFHLSGRLESDQHPTSAFAYVGPYMRNSTWSENRVTTPNFVALSTYLDYVLPADDVRPLVLQIVDVTWRPSFPLVDLLDDQQTSVRIRSRYLHIDWQRTEHLPPMPVPILICHHSDPASLRLFRAGTATDSTNKRQCENAPKKRTSRL